MTKLLIDGNHLTGRCRATLGDMMTSKGELSGVVYGFIKGLFWVQSEVRVETDNTVICWDYGRSEVRMNLYPDYKGNRAAKTPEAELQYESYLHQLNSLNLGLEHLGCKQVRVKGIEADDLIGIFSAFYRETMHENVVIYSGDHDMHQLVRSGSGAWVRVFDAKKRYLDEETVLKNWDVPSIAHIPYYKALVGDNSDNIDGVDRIGDKTAVKILKYLLISADGQLTWSPTQDKSALKWIGEFNKNWGIIHRNVRLMKIPRSWEESLYSKEQALSALEQLSSRGRKPDDLQLMQFFKRWELNSLVESYKGF